AKMRQHHIGKPCPFVTHRASTRREAVRLCMSDCGKGTFIPARNGGLRTWANGPDRCRAEPPTRTVSQLARFACLSRLGKGRFEELAAGDEVVERRVEAFAVLLAQAGRRRDRLRRRREP